MQFTTEYVDADDNLLGTYSSSPLLVNGSLYDSIQIYEDGAFSFFNSAIGAQAIDPYFSVFAADMVSDPTLFATSPGSVSYTIGFSMGLSDATPDAAAAEAGIRLYWNNLALAGDDSGLTQDLQAYIYFLDNGDFDLDFRYGSGDWSGTGTQFINVAGSEIYSNTAALVAEDDYFFSFRNGVLQGGTTPPDGVPEPGTLALMLAGIAGLAASRRRRLRTLA